VMGPWRHSGVNYDGSSLGPLKWDGDTALQFRRDVLKPFFDQYLKNGAAKADTPPVFIYNTGENHWDRFKSWPLACDSGCTNKMKPLYLAANSGLSFAAPAEDPGKGYDEYVSDPANPVPYRQRPISPTYPGGDWRTWEAADQRFVDHRPDVLSFVSAPLDHDLTITGALAADLFASTSGTDSDIIVKLIDVYPQDAQKNSWDPEEGPKPGQYAQSLNGYELPIAMDIFRGRYRDSLSHPSAIPAGKVQRYRFALPHVNHVFLPGHRLMLQIQSSWFPIYDRNPQSYVDNIFFAKPADYRKATQRVFRGGATASFIELPVVSAR